MNGHVLQISGLTKSFSGFVAVDNVSLSVKQGAIHSLIGPNGAGKTTFFNLLTKFLEPTSGSILYKGGDITGKGPDAIARMGLVRSFQISAVFNSLTVRENVMRAIQRLRGESFDFWRSKSVLDEKMDKAEALIDAVGISSLIDLPAGELSYGHKRALEIATTLALEPDVILLDEPTAGIGIEDIERITQLIESAAKGRTVLMVEHNLNIVSQISTHVTVLARGRILAEGDYASVASNRDVIDAYLGGGHG